MAKKIGFVGVGRMGANMARRLNDCGYKIASVYDVNRNTAEAVAKELGTKHSRKLADVTASSDIIITVVTNDAAMRRIFFNKNDNLLTSARGKIFINCATLTPKVHVEIDRAARRAKAFSLEACMASSIPQARQGNLYLMIGGKKETFQRVKAMLSKMSSNLRYIGGPGKAAEVKALVNMVMNINTAGLAEGLGLGKSLGLDLKTLMSVFSQTGANSRVLETDGEDMVIRDHECYFSADHAAKDSGIALKLANEQGLNLPLATATKAQFEKMKKLGIGGLDKSGIAELTFPGRKGDKGGKKK